MELIKIERRNIAEGEINTVNARELHGFLENKDHFATWIKERISQFGFSQGVDYVIFSANAEKGGRPPVEYHLTIDMAKELSMVERNEKGKQARQYFISCERKAKQDPMVSLQDPHIMRSLLLSYSEKVIEKDAEIAEKDAVIKSTLPIVAGFNRFSYADGLTCMTNAAKDLQVRPSDLIKWLNENKWIYKRPGSRVWTAYQDKIQQGLMSHKSTTVTTSDGREKTVDQALLTAKGIAKISTLLPPPASLTVKKY